MNITLTGIDIQTELSKLKEVNMTYGNRIEYGILLSANPKSNRYPEISQIIGMLSQIKNNVSIAIHICGGAARANALKGVYNDILHDRNVGRIQVNGKVTQEELHEFCQKFPAHCIITQDCPANFDLAEVDVRGHDILLDSSGGRGVVRSNWEIPEHLHGVAYSGRKRIGFAGGLGEDNLAEVYPLISQIYPLEPWVDMETKLRDETDWFDIDKAHRCATLVESRI